MASAMMRWRPIADLSELRERLDQAFGATGEAWNPRIDVVKKDAEMVLKADLPGVKPDEIKIEVEDGVLTVSGQHEEKTEEKEERYLRRERHLGLFSRSMALPEGVTAGDIEATTTDGVLELTIPLPKPDRKPAETVRVRPEKEK